MDSECFAIKQQHPVEAFGEAVDPWDDGKGSVSPVIARAFLFIVRYSRLVAGIGSAVAPIFPTPAPVVKRATISRWLTFLCVSPILFQTPGMLRCRGRGRRIGRDQLRICARKGPKLTAVTIVLGALIVAGVFTLGWRWASRKWSLPCPSLLAWSLDNSFVQRSPMTLKTLDRIGLHLGEKVLEIGPGPGRLLIPAAKGVMPGGEVVGIDIQPKMVERLKRNAEKAGVTNLTVILGDATQPHVPEVSMDVIFLCTVLGEIPDRSAALAQCYRALKHGGKLSVTELILDPHYQRRSTVRRLAEGAGFRFVLIEGGWWFYTATFVKA
jgi:precorrin-6B methylase 2